MTKQDDVIEAAAQGVVNVLGSVMQLTCTVCDHKRQIHKGDAAQFLSTGWPKHHGLTMILSSVHTEVPA